STRGARYITTYTAKHDSSYYHVLKYLRHTSKENHLPVHVTYSFLYSVLIYYFVYLTVSSNVDDSMDIMHKETFDPVAPVTTFLTLEEAVNIVNDTPFGLAAYFFTNDYKAGTYLHENLDYGIVGWNDGGPSAAHAPFG